MAATPTGDAVGEHDMPKCHPTDYLLTTRGKKYLYTKDKYSRHHLNQVIKLAHSQQENQAS